MNGTVFQEIAVLNYGLVFLVLVALALISRTNYLLRNISESNMLIASQLEKLGERIRRTSAAPPPPPAPKKTT